MEEQNFSKKFGERLQEERLSLGLTQTQFGELTGFSSEYIHDIETNKKIPTLAELKQMCDTLHLDIKYLISGKHAHYELIGNSKKYEELKQLLSQCDETQYELCIKKIRAFLFQCLYDAEDKDSQK